MLKQIFCPYFKHLKDERFIPEMSDIITTRSEIAGLSYEGL